MKFAIFILLGLCAVVAHASYEFAEFSEYDEFEIEPQNEITDQIKAKIEQLLKKATEDFNKISAKVGEIMERVRDQARKIISRGKDVVEKAKGDIEGKLDELKKKGGAFAECAKNLHPEFRQVEKDTVSGLKKCASDATASSEESRREIEKSFDVIKTNLRQIRDQVADCLGWNPIKTGKCIFEKTSELKKLLNGVLSAGRDGLRYTNKRAKEIVIRVKKCNGNVLSEAQGKVKDLNRKLSDCYKAAPVFF